jgi:hypothetical protein
MDGQLKPVEDTAMGSPISGWLGKIFLEEYDKNL